MFVCLCTQVKTMGTYFTLARIVLFKIGLDPNLDQKYNGNITHARRSQALRVIPGHSLGRVLQ